MTNMIDEDCIARYDEVGSLKKGDTVILKNRPCKLSEIHTSKGHAKHGHSKAIVVGFDVLTDKKIEFSYNVSDRLPVPIISKDEYLLTYLDEEANTISVMDKKNNTIDFDIDCDEELKANLFTAYEEDELTVEILTCFGRDKIVGFKVVKTTK